MMGYLDELRAFVSEKRPDEAPTKPTKPGSVSFVGSPQGQISEIEAKANLKRWHRHLTVVDPLLPPSGWCPRYWRRLVEDAHWLYSSHASYADRNGWSAACLWAVRPGMPHLGSLADMLEGSRDLKLVGGRAYWTILGVPHRINVGAGDGSGAVLLWEVAK